MYNRYARGVRNWVARLSALAFNSDIVMQKIKPAFVAGLFLVAIERILAIARVL